MLVKRFHIYSLFLFFLGLSSCIFQRSTEDPSAHPLFKESYYNASKEKILGNSDAALKLYFDCLERVPESGVVNYEIASLYYDRRDYTAALHYASAAVDYESENLWYQRLLADVYRANGDFKSAQNLYESLYESCPADNMLVYDLISVYKQTGADDRSLKLLDALKMQYGTSEYIVREKNQIYLKRGQQAKMLGELTELVVTYPDNYRFRGMLAEYYLGVGDYDKASHVYDTLLSRWPDEGEVQLSLANYYRIIGDRDSSLHYLYLSFGNPYLDALPKIRVLQTNSYYDATQDSAYHRALLDTLSGVHPYEPLVTLLYVEVLISEQLYKEAEQKLESQLAVRRDNYKIWESLMHVLYVQESYNDLVLLTDSAQEYFPNQAEIYLIKGMAYNKLSEYKQAVDQLEMGQSLVVDDVPLLVEFYVELGRSYHHIGKYKRSGEYFDMALMYDSRSGDIHLAYGQMLYSKKDYDLAREQLDIVFERKGRRDAVALELYGDILYRIGDTGGAVDHWQEAKSLGAVSDELDEKIATKRMKDN